MWENPKELAEAVRKEPWAHALHVQEDFWLHLTDWVKDHFLADFLTQFVHQVDEIIEINPDLPEPEILTRATRYMVEFLGALYASVRIYDPLTQKMLSYGSFPSDEESRETFIPLEGSIAGKVVKSRQAYLVPDILGEDLYKDKDIVERKGARSLMAVPLEIPRFFPNERDTVGLIQIYYPEPNRHFRELEIQVARVMSRRLSFVIARKKILNLYRINEKKEAIVRRIFLKLDTREGVKMKEVFNRVIPELADIINIQSCALFSVTEDNDHVLLEAGYPESIGYHGIGKRFPIHSEPAFELVLKRGTYREESLFEVVSHAYVLVIDPEKSNIISKNVKNFAASFNINSILYVPLSSEGDITHFMTFDARDQRRRYTEDEIEIFVFLGRELMKAQRMEYLDDILHDFKNPAIATAGFARRLKLLLEKKETEKDDERVKRYLDILLDETSRLQEMALSIYQVGKALKVNFTSVLKNRFNINQEAIKEQLKSNVALKEGPFMDPLYVRCYPLHVERVLDNLFNNATNAIPHKGGTLSIRSYEEGDWACAEISNTGRIPEEDRLRLLEGEGRGRGLYITHRIIRLLRGKLEVRVEKETTIMIIRLPLYRDDKPAA